MQRLVRLGLTATIVAVALTVRPLSSRSASAVTVGSCGHYSATIHTNWDPYPGLTGWFRPNYDFVLTVNAKTVQSAPNQFWLACSPGPILKDVKYNASDGSPFTQEYDSGILVLGVKTNLYGMNYYGYVLEAEFEFYPNVVQVSERMYPTGTTSTAVCQTWWSSTKYGCDKTWHTKAIA